MSNIEKKLINEICNFVINDISYNIFMEYGLKQQQENNDSDFRMSKSIKEKLKLPLVLSVKNNNNDFEILRIQLNEAIEQGYITKESSEDIDDELMNAIGYIPFELTDEGVEWIYEHIKSSLIAVYQGIVDEIKAA